MSLYFSPLCSPYSPTWFWTGAFHWCTGPGAVQTSCGEEGTCSTVAHMIGWLVDWLIDWLIDRLIGWLVGWLIDWLLCIFLRAMCMFLKTQRRDCVFRVQQVSSQSVWRTCLVLSSSNIVLCTIKCSSATCVLFRKLSITWLLHSPQTLSCAW